MSKRAPKILAAAITIELVSFLCGATAPFPILGPTAHANETWELKQHQPKAEKKRRKWKLWLPITGLSLGALAFVPDKEKLAQYSEEVFMESIYIHPNDPHIQELAKGLARGRGSDYEKLGAIYDWVTANIRYDDHAELFGGFAGLRTPRSMDASEILKNRQAICQGYSDLMASLLKAANIPVKVVMGKAYSKNGRDLGLHAWNKALVDGRWVSFDATWGAGSSPTRIYFDPNPEFFEKSHVEILER